MWTSQSQIIVGFCFFFQIHLSSLCSLRCEVYTLPSDALYANYCRGFLRAASPPGRFRKQPEHRFRAKVQHLFFSFNIKQQQIKNWSYLFFALTAPSNKLNACVISLWPFCVFLHPPKTSLPPAGRASERRSTCAVINHHQPHPPRQHCLTVCFIPEKNKPVVMPFVCPRPVLFSKHKH